MKITTQKVLGINKRNIDFIFEYNEKKNFNIVDNKLATKKLLAKNNIPTSTLISYCQYHYEIKKFINTIKEKEKFVIKPARGLAGGGVLIINKKEKNCWKTVNNIEITIEDLYMHAMDILTGVYSIDNYTDIVLAEELIIQHDFFDNIYPHGISDIRVIIFKGIPVMSMARIPTRESHGKANMTLGAIGAGINIDTGEIIRAVTKKREYKYHPDTKKQIIGSKIPMWDDVLSLCKIIGNTLPLKYIGADIVLDKNKGPIVLELNARPGLEIQNANLKGLFEEIKHRVGDF